MPSLLIANDEPALYQSLQPILESEGYQVHCVHDGEQALTLLARIPFDLVLLDMMLPKLNGLQAARRICQRFSTPIIMLSAVTDEAAKIKGYEAGADHYLTKPFSPPKLLALIKASLRRVALEKQRHAHYLTLPLTDELSHHLTILRRLPFTQTELDLVTYLAAHTRKVISKAELQHQVLKRELCPFDRNLDMHISNIRRKLSQAGWSKSTIRTARGVGYQFYI